jgi:phage gpG-like protein
MSERGEVEISIGWIPPGGTVPTAANPFDVLYKATQLREAVVSDLIPFWNRLGPAIGGDLSRNFDAGGNEIRGVWHPNTAKWREWKEAHGFSAKVLVMTGALWSAVRTAGARGNIFFVEKKWMIWGVDAQEIPYAAIHNWGGVIMHTNPWSGKVYVQSLPQRMYLVLHGAFTKMIGRIFATWYAEMTRGTGSHPAGQVGAAQNRAQIGGI